MFYKEKIECKVIKQMLLLYLKLFFNDFPKIHIYYYICMNIIQTIVFFFEKFNFFEYNTCYLL